MSQRAAHQIRAAFLDSSAFFAFADEDDANHTTATTIFTRLTVASTPLVTTNFVVAETHALLLNRLGYAVATAFLTRLDSSRITIVRATAADEARARSIVFQYQDKDFSLVDAISFAIMERLDIRYAFTFDRHFAQYGWTELNPEMLAARAKGP